MPNKIQDAQVFFSQPRTLDECAKILGKYGISTVSSNPREVEEMVADLFQNEMIDYDLCFERKES